MFKSMHRSSLLTTWRRRLFALWIVAAVASFMAVMVGGPIASIDGSDGTAAIALVVPAMMAVFIISALAWLVLLVISHRSPYTHKPPAG